VRRRQAVARRINLSSKCLYLDHRTLLLQRIDLGLKCGKYFSNTLLQVNLAESRSLPSRPHEILSTMRRLRSAAPGTCLPRRTCSSYVRAQGGDLHWRRSPLVLPHPIQRFFRSATAAVHQIVGAANDVCSQTPRVPELLPSQHESRNVQVA
jgi:hypothetical protein